jgi:uncharacterized protein with PQ loop repeat
MNESAQYLLFGILTFVFGLSNSIPAWLRVYKTKNVQSISFYTQVMRIFCAIIAVTALICVIIPRWEMSVVGKIKIEIWLPCQILDLVVNVFGLFCATYIFALILKQKNKFRWRIKINKNNIWIIVVFALLALAQLTLLIIFRVEALDKNINAGWTSTTPFVFWIRFVSGIVAVFTMLPLTIKIITTKNTYSISFIAECSLLVAMGFWITYDCMSVFYAGLNETISYIISDIYVTIWVIIIFSYKLKNLIIGKRKSGKWIDCSLEKTTLVQIPT